MAKRVAPRGDAGSGPEVGAALDAARRELGRLGKRAHRRFERLERRIDKALANEQKRSGQLDEARAELASLIERLADLVRPAGSEDVRGPRGKPDAASSDSALKPAATKVRGPKAATIARPTRSRRAAGPSPRTARTDAPITAGETASAPTARRRSLRSAGTSPGRPDS